MRFTRATRRAPRIDLSPLIDVVFQLLLFYAVTTQFVADDRMKLKLPEAKTAERQASETTRPTEVVVNAAGDVLVDGRVVRDADLDAAIRQIVAKDPERGLTIRGDQGADYGKVVAVLDAARSAGAKAINLAAVKPQDARKP